MDQADRDKTLEMAMSQIERQFGKGAIMKLSDSAVKNVAAIPTGALSLDLALGIGGVPRGRVVEIFGPESSGKCLVADTQLWTDHGLETVAEFFERLGQPASCTSRVTDVSEFGARVVNERGELETVTALTHNNRRPVVEITLRSGRGVKVTMNHPLRVLNERGAIVWREAKEISEGDTLVSATFGAVEATGGEHLSEDEAVLLGYLVAEGSLSSPNTVGFTNKDDEVGTEFSDLMGRLFDAKIERYGDKEYRVHSKEIRSELADGFGLDYVTAAGKSVPNRVRVGGHKVQRAFLSALFEGDGWIDGSSTIGLASASQLLAQQVQLMLYGLGVPCSLSAKFNTEYQRDCWTVTVNPAVAHRFLEEVGFRSARRRGQVEKNFRHSPRDPQLENTPHLSGLIQDLRDSVGGDREFDRIAGDVFRADMDLEVSRSRLARIIGWARERDLPASGRAILGYLEELADHRYTFESVVSVRDAGEEPTFDIVVPGTHSFLANGMLSHNTTLALHVVAEAQRNGGVAAFIDAEHALDPEYAKALGVDVDELLISQPDTGEQALEIADMLIRSGALDVVVVDSVAALVPRAELEGDMGDTHVGLQARLMSQALRKLAGTINRSDTTAIFINQLREKIGVMFGCLNWDSPVTLADGSSMPIGKIVNQKLDVEVLSYDPDAEAVVPARLVNWYDNGKTEEFVRITVPRTVGRGASPSFAATSNHLVRTPGGWKAAGDLGVGDRVMRLATRRLSGFQMEVILGALMGDGALSPSPGSFGARFRMGHGAKQQEYLDWKASLFANIDSSSHTNGAGAGFFDLTPLPELVRIREAVYWPNGKTLSYDYLKRLTPLSLAIWYQDDGHLAIRSKDPTSLGARGRVEICVKALEESSRTRLVEHLRDTWGLDARLTEKGALETPTLIFGNDATEKFLALIAEHIHPSMEYKLLPKHRGQFGVEAMFEEPSFGLVALPITDTRVVRPTQRRHRYDLEVEGHHNYFAGGVMVHNSPETTPGGRALKFYASVRIDVRRIEAIKQGTDNVGNKVRAKIVKNKVAPPFRVAEFDIMFGEGISREGSLIDVAVEQGIVRKAGAWYTFDGDQLGQGREKAKQFLRENPELAMQLQDRVLRAVGVIEDEEDEAEETEAVEGAESGDAADEG